MCAESEISFGRMGVSGFLRTESHGCSSGGSSLLGALNLGILGNKMYFGVLKFLRHS